MLTHVSDEAEGQRLDEQRIATEQALGTWGNRLLEMTFNVSSQSSGVFGAA